MTDAAEEKRKRDRADKAAQRERARAAGLCIVNPAHGAVPAGTVTCKRCQDEANVRLAKRRKRRRQPA